MPTGGSWWAGTPLAVVTDDGVERTVFEPPGGWGFNDFVADADGSVYVGMHGERPTAGVSTNEDRCGCYVRAARRRSATATSCSPTASASRQTAPGCTTWTRGVARFWSATSPTMVCPLIAGCFCEVPQGSPDGMAIDESGCLWVAIVNGGCIVRITPDGQEDLVLQGPRAWVASVTFGGDDGRDLYAVTFGAPYDDAHTGGVFRTRVSVAGGRIWPARI